MSLVDKILSQKGSFAHCNSSQKEVLHKKEYRGPIRFMESCPDLPVMNDIYSKKPKIISQTGKKVKELK